jgi:hypothetical protein
VGTLHARSTTGRITVSPVPGLVVRFGRGSSRPDDHGVQLGVGTDDLRVSRWHGELTFRQSYWWLRNTGQQLIRLPRGRMLHESTDPIPLTPGYTPVYVKGSAFRDHLVELYVTGGEAQLAPLHDRITVPPTRWPLSDDERLVLVALGQRYLLYEPDPSPLTYRQAALELDCLRPEARWGAKWQQRRAELTPEEFRKRVEKKVARTVENVRHRLEKSGDFPYELRRNDSDRTYDDTLRRNLLRGLVDSTTLVPPDLSLLDDNPDGSSD